ncbi:unnamed protein product [Citrullus colocynthis]|uniref:Uncharacterized protein n=1 Tax=Citrullus colocynthis TaxID=252529 RepID=A0ABP0XKH6_9ROSI
MKMEMNAFAGNHCCLISLIEFQPGKRKKLRSPKFSNKDSEIESESLTKPKYLEASPPQIFFKLNANPIVVQRHSL